ncbi:hypothetical protein [Methanofollis ethanolicus]|uniref:hypothetical protein n=1 Tax=Methanofollis ethanolicus TaxID=488124 RepID=UPI000835843D|nr:hypothetical protein [Methanofollis ethanolicus]
METTATDRNRLVMVAMLCPLLVAAALGAAVDLTLDGPGAGGMAFPGLKPGDTGTTTVLLHNAGSEGGSVAVWISDITETDARADGARLDTYLLFSLSNERLASTLDLPAPITSFPQGPGGSPAVTVTHLEAGATTALVWHWDFRETGTPQDDAQGDTLAFTVHYTLTTLPPDDTGGGGGGGGGHRHVQASSGSQSGQHSTPTTLPEETRTIPTTITGETAPEDRIPLLEALLLMLLIGGMVRLRHEPSRVLKVAAAAGIFLLLVAALPIDYRVLCCVQPPGILLAAAAPLIPVAAGLLSQRQPTTRTLWAGEYTLLFLSVAAGFGLLTLGAGPLGSLLGLAAVYLVTLGVVLIMER